MMPWLFWNSHLHNRTNGAWRKAVEHTKYLETHTFLKEAIKEECGSLVADYLALHANLGAPKTLMLSTTTRFNILKQPDHKYNTIINLKRVNDIQYLNKFFEWSTTSCPPTDSSLAVQRQRTSAKNESSAKFPPLLNWIAYTLDFMLKRVFPKFKPTKRIYFLLTRGNNRVLSQG